MGCERGVQQRCDECKDVFHSLRQEKLGLLYQLASGDEVYEFTECVIFSFPIGLESAKSRLVSKTERATERIGDETIGEVVREELGVIYEIGSNVARTIDRLAAIFPSRIDGGSVWVRAAVLANWVVSFEHETERIDLRMTVGAGLDVTMFL